MVDKLTSEESKCFLHYNRGVKCLRKGQYAEAISHFEKAIKSYPEFALAYSARGHAYVHNGEYDRAIFDLNKALEIDPRVFPEPYSELGIAYACKGKYDDAIAVFNKALEMDSKQDHVYYKRAFCYFMKGQYREGILDLSTAIEINPKHAVL